MHSAALAAAAAPSQGSGAKRRCISSLQVTYHQEIQKPASQLVTRRPPPDYNSCGPVDPSLENTCLQETDELVPSPEEQYFYTFAPLQNPACPASGAVLQHEVHGLDPAQHHGPPLPCSPVAPHSPLFGLEDGLRHRINVEIEKFRASIQEVMREQFASQRHPPMYHSAPQQHCTIKKKGEMEDTCIQSLEVAADHLASSNQTVHGETSIDSGVDISPTVEATPPSVDEEMNLALIRLQTLAAVVSSNLQRAEYTTTH